MALVHFPRLSSLRLTASAPRLVVGLIGLAGVIAGCSKSTPTQPFLPGGDRLRFQSQVTSVIAGVVIPPFKIQIVDTGGGLVIRNAVDITLTLDSTDPRDTLFGPTVAQTVQGEATFGNLFFKHAAPSFRLVATARGLTGAVSQSFSVSVGAPSKLAFSVQPSSVIAGDIMVPAPQVVVQDGFGNPIANDTGLVVLQVLTGPSGATPRNGAVNAVAGTARFDSLRINTAGPSFTLQAVGPNGRNLQPAISSLFLVTPGTPRKVVFTQQPSQSVVNTAINPPMTVSIADSLNNIATSFSGPVVLDIDVNPTGAALGGTTTVNAASGVATFTGISINLTCQTVNCYRLRATAAAVPSDTARSGFFTIVP